MARVCAICKKGGRVNVTRVLLRGNYNPTAKKRKNPNLQWVRPPAGKTGLPIGKRVLACTNCIKSLHKKAK